MAIITACEKKRNFVLWITYDPKLNIKSERASIVQLVSNLTTNKQLLYCCFSLRCTRLVLNNNLNITTEKNVHV